MPVAILRQTSKCTFTYKTVYIIHSRFPHTTTGCVLWLSREASAANHVALSPTFSICDMRRCSIVVTCQSQLEGHVGLTNIAQP
jgi:hypothetical protein